MIHLTTMQTPEGLPLAYTVEALNCVDPELDNAALTQSGCTVSNGNAVHFFKMWTCHTGDSHYHDAKRKALELSALLCVGVVQKTETLTIQQFEGDNV